MRTKPRRAAVLSQAAATTVSLQRRHLAVRDGRPSRPSGLRRWARSTAIAGLWVLSLMAGLAMGADRVLAEGPQPGSILHLTGSNQSFAADLALLCPGGNSAAPQFQNRQTGQITPIADPRLRAIAEKACSQDLPGAGASSTVTIQNNRSTPVFVGFTGSVTWSYGANCIASGAGIEIQADKSCQGSIPATAGVTRFCASPTSPAPTNCWDAQKNHQTLIETNFQPSCFNQGTCVWYDISVIPSFCTDDDWLKDRCKGDGGAAYNLPVSLTCSGEPTFTCKGPTSTKYGPQEYPSNCADPGNPYPPHCVGNTPQCVNAYFYPMFNPPENKYQPNAVCPGGRTLTMTFLPGP